MWNNACAPLVLTTFLLLCGRALQVLVHIDDTRSRLYLVQCLTDGFSFTVREASLLLDLFSPVDNRVERAAVCAALLPFIIELPEDGREVYDCASLTTDYPFFVDRDGDGVLGTHKCVC
jgi:hypothetical protein